MSEKDQLLESYLPLVGSFWTGLVRLQQARIFGLSAIAALSKYRSRETVHTVDHPYADVLDPIRAISYAEYDAFEYILNWEHLVYATTILDTFLSDTTRFLLLLHPGAIGTSRTVPFEAILSGRSRSDLINQEALKRSREVSYLPFLARLDFLRTTFGLKLAVSSDDDAALDHFSGIRNLAVHDQSAFDVFLDDSSQLIVKQKSCARHPTRITGADLETVRHAFCRVAQEVCRAVVEQVIMGAGDPRFVALYKAFTTYTEWKPPTRSASAENVGDLK